MDELFRFIGRAFPDTLEAFEVDEATELDEEMLDNVDKVETGDIVDVLPNPPPPTPPEIFSLLTLFNYSNFFAKRYKIVITNEMLSKNLFYLSMSLVRNHYCYDYAHAAGRLKKVLMMLSKKHLKTFSTDGLV